MASKVLKKAVIPVAGLGTRSLPFSKCIPKEMLPVIETPTIQFIVEECVAAGIEEVILVTSDDKSAIREHFSSDPKLEGVLRSRGKSALADSIHTLSNLCRITCVKQPVPLGLGHAISCARGAVGQEVFAVCLGDEIFPPWHSQFQPALIELAMAFRTLATSVVGVVKIPAAESERYGIVDIQGKDLSKGPVRIAATVEKPKPDKAPSRFAVIGRYIFTPDIFEELERVKPGTGGEIQLTDAMDRVAKQNGLYAVEIRGVRYDMGNPFYFVKAQIDAALRRPEIAEPLRQYLETL